MDVKKITAEYDRKTARDKKLAELERQAREGLRKWQAAEEFASRTGMTTAEVLISGFLEAYPDGKIPEADARELTLSLLKHNYERVSKVAESAQMATNEEAGVGLKAVIPEFNKDRAEGIAKNIAAAEDLSEHSDQVGKEIENNSRSVVDDTIRENTKAHEQVGLEPRITRIYDGVGLSNGRVCEWCLERCGNDMTYQEAYEKGAFQRHPGCGCELYYKTGKRVQRQTDWSSNKWDDVPRESAEERLKELRLSTSLRLKDKNAGEIPRSYSERGIELPERLKEILVKLQKPGQCIEGGPLDYQSKDVRIIAIETKAEFARISFSDKSYLVRGDITGTNLPEWLVQEMVKNDGRLDFHVHPYNGDLIPSGPDRETMKVLESKTGQTISQIVSADGRIASFSKHGIIDIVETVNNSLSEEDKEALLRLFGEQNAE